MSTEETKPVAKAETKPVAQPPPKELPAFEKSIADRLETKFGSKTTIEFVKPTRIRVKVGKENVLEVAKFIRDELHFDHAESVTGTDYPSQKEIEVVYHLGSYTDPALAKQVLALATRAPREEIPNPGNDSTKLPSLRDIFYSV